MRIHPEWRSGWPIVLTAALGFTASMGHLYGVGVLLSSIEESFGWSRTMASSGVVIVSVFAATGAPLIGFAVDRFGPRRFALAGTAIYSTGFVLLSFLDGGYLTWWAAWTLVGLGFLCLSGAVWTTAIVGHFDATRGVALACALSGSGIASATLPLLSGTLAEHFGWRGALAGLGIIDAAIVLPMTYFFFFGPKDRQHASSSREAPKQPDGMAGLDALFSWRFIKLAVACFAFILAIVGTIFHFVPILEWGGIPKTQAAAMAGTIGVFGIIGRIGTGFLIDRLRADLIGAVVFAMPALAWLGILAGWFGGAGPYVIAATVGLATGAEIDIIAYLVSRVFGLRSFGFLFGCMGGLINLGVGLGPVVGSAFYDRFGGYLQAGWFFIVLFLIGSAVMLTFGRLSRPGEVSLPLAAKPLSEPQS